MTRDGTRREERMVEYVLREATPDDMLLLFGWTNDPEVRAQ